MFADLVSRWRRSPVREPQPPRPEPRPAERRRHYRNLVSWPARLRLRDGSVQAAELRDLSLGGTRLLAGAEPCPPGALLEVELTRQGLTFRSAARVLATCGRELRLEFVNPSVVATDVLAALLTGNLGFR